jgi:hypothetical protein
MSAFSAAFRDIVVPILRREIAIEALHVAYGRQGWSESYDEVVHLAISRGALHLPDEEWDRLRDWIAARMLRWIDFYSSDAPSPVRVK